MLPAIFISHGAPTLALEPSAARDFLIELGRDLDRRYGRPRAVLVASAHWETPEPTVSTAERPETIYDFGGFPDELYSKRYPAPGATELAKEARALLTAKGFAASTDERRGLDHGAWVAMSLLYPAADVPTTQLSVQPGQGPRHHFAIGEALRPLRSEGVLVLGSGAITHNLRELFGGGGQPMPHVGEFVDWIGERIDAGDVESLLEYRARAPHAERNHPTDEHLLPLFVSLGAGSPGARPRRIHQSETFGWLRMDAFEAP